MGRKMKTVEVEMDVVSFLFFSFFWGSRNFRLIDVVRPLIGSLSKADAVRTVDDRRVQLFDDRRSLQRILEPPFRAPTTHNQQKKESANRFVPRRAKLM